MNGSSEYDLLSVYPNPAHEQFEINYITTKDSEYRIDLIDAEGRIVWNMNDKGDGLLQKASGCHRNSTWIIPHQGERRERVKQLKVN
ncbi:MAG: T9SS type A sorting domain-containing protein [Bacteroidetes bacterium]|nr:T9SS type A sorting domain-containing protein [Bacteroidota bacterium]